MPQIKVYPCDMLASGHYRTIWPATAAANTGADVEIDYIGPKVLWDREWKDTPGDAVAVEVEKPDCEVVVISRPRGAYWVDIIAKLRKHGVKVVVDIDDDLEAIARDNVVYAEFNNPNSRAHYRFTRAAIQLANLVTVTTPALAHRYGSAGTRTRVLPNLVPAWYLDVPSPDSKQIGWAGAVGTHPQDLQVTGGAVGRYDGPVRIVGEGWGACPALGLCTERTACAGVPLRDPISGSLDPNSPEAVQALDYRCGRVESTGWQPFDIYPSQVAQIGIGIAPLADTLFNRSKSALKVMEMAALGVPVVASPSPDNERVAQFLNVRLASTPQKWHRHLSALRKSETLRVEVAESNRQTMREYTYGAQGMRWVHAWESVLS